MSRKSQPIMRNELFFMESNAMMDKKFCGKCIFLFLYSRALNSGGVEPPPSLDFRPTPLTTSELETLPPPPLSNFTMVPYHLSIGI